jgi:hypothetical protein
MTPSILTTPNQYAPGSILSIIPTDGSGDLSVTRATSATRVDANGLVEIPRTNLVLQSQTFENASWSKTAATITANASTAPDGTLTADKFIPNTSATNHAIGSNNFALGTNTISVYAKMDGYRYLVILSATANASFDLMNGVVANNSGGGFVSYSITNAGNGWYRCILTVNTTSISSMFISGGSSSASAFFNGAGDGTSGILIWGAQVEAGNVVTEYIPTIASIRTKFAGITQDGSSASNIPRLDYTNGSCPSILVEPQRTNLFSFSEQFDNGAWNLSRTNAFGSGSIANATTAPDGTTSAEYIQQQNGQTLSGGIFRSISVTSGTVYSFSVFAKQSDNRFLRLGFSIGTGGTAIFCNFDLQDGISGTPSAGLTPTITNFGNGWFRCSITATSQVTTSANQFIYQANGLNSSIATENIGIFIWGAQLEVGSYATSYIPTVAASVTRNADVISKTGISSLIGQTEGTLFVDFYNQLLNSTLLCINKNATNAIFINISNTGTIIGRYYANSILTTTNATTYTTFNQRIKVALKYGSFGIKLFVNGVLKGTNSTSIAFTSSLSDIFLNDGVVININEKIINNNVQVYKTALTDDECINLTTI